MCGIAGAIDLTGRRPVAEEMLRAMATAIVHRGPDEDGLLERPGLGLASRRLSIIGLADGRQPITNEDGSVAVVYNGELFDYPEVRAQLEARGHRFRTHCDTEIIPHLYEEHGEGMVERLHGQFALALWDERQRRLMLARDRFGICPLFWTRQKTTAGDWLLFASEIKALLATGLVDARPNLRGIDQVFSFFALPPPVTCFQGIEALVQGHFLTIQLQGDGQAAEILDRAFWEIDFPDRGQEEGGTDTQRLLDEFEAVLTRAVQRRLRADVPVVSYLSGGVDSTTVVTLATRIRGKAPPTFTVRIEDPELDETRSSSLVAERLKAEPVVVGFGAREVLETYPELIRAAECPVVDTACAALLLLAKEVHARGYKVALTGEGADEWLAGYPWYKMHRLLNFLDVVPGVRLSTLVRRAFVRLSGSPRFPWAQAQRTERAAGGPNAWLEAYGLMSLSKLRFYGPKMREANFGHPPYEELNLPLERMQRWHPLNRSLYLGARIMLPGLLLSCKGDRVAMHSSVETRYPFLDEEVFDFCARLHPRWKLHGFRDKYILRLLGERFLPPEIVRRHKAMFRAPFDTFYTDPAPPFVDQLLSDESLNKTGYFDPQAVRHWRRAFRQMRPGSNARTGLEMGLVAVLGTQLWHHTYIDGGLADLPSLGGPPPARAAS
ncbi:MAG TPA: asparagine synthase (glutamine-hydrolyzing) [Gemmataceae bacterium]|nr:asparagine synthase (glutamine-hydrolyzing) [Gemmataceae bacterium]